jgi:hypothetical protein
LNGDLLSIQHKPSRGFEHFQRMIYNECTHIPYGCLVLRRLVQESDDLDEVSQLMLLPDIYSDEDVDESIVTEVYDGDEIIATIDTTLVESYMIRNRNIAIPSSNPKFQHYVSVYSINFRSKEDEFESQTVVFHDTDNDLFSLCDHFIQPTPQEAAEYHRDGMVEVYKPTPQTVWFPTLSECLVTSMDRFPHDSDTLQNIEKQFNEYSWEWNADEDDDDEYAYDHNDEDEDDDDDDDDDYDNDFA